MNTALLRRSSRQYAANGKRFATIHLSRNVDMAVYPHFPPGHRYVMYSRESLPDSEAARREIRNRLREVG